MAATLTLTTIAAALAVASVLEDAGYSLQSVTEARRGAHVLQITGPAGTAGFHGTITISARSGRITGAQLRPEGEHGPTVDVRGADVYMRVCDALNAIERRIPWTERHVQMAASLSGEYVPSVAEMDAAFRLQAIWAEALANGQHVELRRQWPELANNLDALTG